MFLESGTIFKSFPSQKEFSFALSLTPHSSSGEVSVGFSGTNGFNNFFKLKNGKIYDPLNRFVYSYSKDDLVNLSGNFCSGSFNYFINNSLTSTSIPVSNSSSSFDHLFLSSVGTPAEFDCSFYGGKKPSYDIVINGSNLLTGQGVSGSIINNSSENWENFKIFSGDGFFNYQTYKFNGALAQKKISVGQSGNFSFDYLGSMSEYSLSEGGGITPLSYNINFYTNFGTLHKSGLLNLGYVPQYYLNFYGFQSGLINSTYYWNNLLEAKLCSESSFSYKLEKISGFNYVNTINAEIPASGNMSGFVSGDLIGTGFLYGNLTGDLYSDYYDYYEDRLIKYGSVIRGSGYGFATGEVVYPYNVNLTGLASGWNSATNKSGIVTGIVNHVGVLTRDAVSGFATWENQTFAKQGSEGNVYVKPSGGSNYTEVSNFWSGDFIGTFNFKIPKTGFYNYFTGIQTYLSTGFSWIDYDADFKYNFDIKSGSWSNNGSIKYSGENINYSNSTNSYTGIGTINPTTCLPLINNESKFTLFEINHYNPYNSGNNVMKYTLSGLDGSYLFTGVIKE